MEIKITAAISKLFNQHNGITENMGRSGGNTPKE
jgi:hypothetical protein